MIATLTDRGLIQRRPGEARAIELLVAPEDLPRSDSRSFNRFETPETEY